MKINFRILIIIVHAFFFSSNLLFSSANFNFDSKYSGLKIASGANFILNQAIVGWDGILIKKSGASISGQTISFDDGTLQDSGDEIWIGRWRYSYSRRSRQRVWSDP